MNDTAKTNIKTRLEKAMESEGIGTNDAARILGISPTYISMIKNPNNWIKCSISGWEAVLKWVNSGQGLKEYSEKHGKVIIESHKPEEEKKEVIGEPVKANVIKAEPEQVVQRMSKGMLVDMLVEEKGLLRKKIEAIDLLLTHYNSYI